MKLPIIQAPMAGVSTPELAAAVSEARALGSVTVELDQEAKGASAIDSIFAHIRATRHQPHGLEATPLAAVAEAIERLRYGVVQLTVHDGRVVQLEVTERQRFA